VDSVPSEDKTRCDECDASLYALSGERVCTNTSVTGALWVDMEVDLGAVKNWQEVYDQLLFLPWVDIYEEREYNGAGELPEA
jgi:hypothetical protein